MMFLLKGTVFALTLIGSVQVPVENHQFSDDWQSMENRQKQEMVLYSKSDSVKIKRWRRALAELRDKSPLGQISGVNRFVNVSVKYTSDIKAFGKPDYWATPMEFMANGGDCEDFAIMKFYSLIELGFNKDDLRLVFVRDIKMGNSHIVLTVKINKDVYVLDNKFNAPIRHQFILKYRPLYSTNLDKQWIHIVTPDIRTQFSELYK